MKYSCIKCNSEFELEREAADIFCPYCGYLAKSDDRNTFYEKIHMIKPIMTKKEFIISQLEKMARIQETPKDVFDNLNFDVKEVYIFYVERKYNVKASYDASVKYKKEEKYTKYIEKTSTDKSGVKVTIKEPVEEVRVVSDTKVISDFINCSDSIIVNFKGSEDKDIELIRNYKNSLEEDNSIEVPIKNIRNVLNAYDDCLSKANDRYDAELDRAIEEKIKEKNANYDGCSNIDFKIDEKELGEIKVYCISKYIWEYKHNNNDYTLSILSPIKKVYGDYPADKTFESTVSAALDEIDKRYTTTINGTWSIASLVLLVLIGFIVFVASSKEIETNNKTSTIIILSVLSFIDLGIAALIGYILKKNCNKKKESTRKKKLDEKADRKNIMCDRLIQNIKDDKYNIK